MDRAGLLVRAGNPVPAMVRVAAEIRAAAAAQVAAAAAAQVAAAAAAQVAAAQAAAAAAAAPCATSWSILERPITPVGNSAQKPNMTGGNIVDGTYILTSIVEYDTTSGFTETRKRTLKVNGNTVQVVNSDNGGPDVHATISIAPAGTSPLLNAAFTCPAVSGTLADYYTAASTSLQLRKSGDNQVYTYTLQNPG